MAPRSTRKIILNRFDTALSKLQSAERLLVDALDRSQCRSADLVLCVPILVQAIRELYQAVESAKKQFQGTSED